MKTKKLDMKIPEINKKYNYFDDGKIKEDRRLEVVIKDIIPFSKIDNSILELWKEEIEECDWLYAKETDYFIKGDLEVYNEIKNIIFVRTVYDEWFSIGFWGGILDVDGSLFKEINNSIN